MSGDPRGNRSLVGRMRLLLMGAAAMFSLPTLLALFLVGNYLIEKSLRKSRSASCCRCSTTWLLPCGSPRRAAPPSA